MTDPTRSSSYDRAAYLATVESSQRHLAEQLCDALEASFNPREISLYSGFPVVVRDGEWLAGFAMRKKCPMVYVCSPSVLAQMGSELKPLMSGKSCLELRVKSGITIDQALERVRKAFRLASTSPGMISKADAKRRDADRAAGKSTATKKTATKKTATKKTANPKSAASKVESKVTARSSPTKRPAK